MTAITYGTHAPAHTATAAKVPAKGGSATGFWTRVWNAFLEAQMRRALREVRMHQHLMPAELEIAGNRISYKNEESLPFVRTRD